MTLNFVAHTSAIVRIVIQISDIGREVGGILQGFLIHCKAFNLLNYVCVMVFERFVIESGEVLHVG